MISAHAKIATNTTWFTLALVLQKIISFVYFTYLARSLGATDLGSYVFALSFIAIFSIIIDFGTNHFITREIAKDSTQAQHIFSNILGFKIITSFIAVIIVFMVINLLNYSPVVCRLVYIASILMVIESLVLSSFALLRGFHNLRYESIGTIAVQLFTMIGGLIILQYSNNLSLLMLVLVCSNLINLIYVLLLLRYKINLHIKVLFDWKYWQSLIRVILPFALAAGFTKIYGAFDQILLSKLASSEALGFYAVAYKLTFALQFLPLALVAALYPAMSTYYKIDKISLNKAFTRAVYYLLIITIPMTAVIFSLASEFINTLYTNVYTESIIPLQILILSLVFLFINFPLGSLLNAADKQTKNTKNIAWAMVINILLNIFFISNYQAIGAALASLLSTIFLFFINSWSVKNLLHIDFKYLILVGVKTVFAGLIMSFSIYYLKSSLHWMLAGLVGSFIYLFLQFVFQTITKRDIIQIYQSFKKREL